MRLFRLQLNAAFFRTISGGSRAAVTSKMGRFLIIFNGFQQHFNKVILLFGDITCFKRIETYLLKCYSWNYRKTPCAFYQAIFDYKQIYFRISFKERYLRASGMHLVYNYYILVLLSLSLSVLLLYMEDRMLRNNSVTTLNPRFAWLIWMGKNISHLSILLLILADGR